MSWAHGASGGFPVKTIHPMKRGEAKSDLNRAVAEVIAELRKSAGLSQEALAFECGLHPTYISKLERGLKTPTLYTIFVIAETIGRQPHEVIQHFETKL